MFSPVLINLSQAPMTQPHNLQSYSKGLSCDEFRNIDMRVECHTLSPKPLSPGAFC